MLLLVSTKNRNLCPGPTTEVRDSRTSVTLRMLRLESDKSDWLWSQSIVLDKSIQNRNVVGPGPEVAILGADQKERGLWGRK